jgi:hypothetical protein
MTRKLAAGLALQGAVKVCPSRAGKVAAFVPSAASNRPIKTFLKSTEREEQRMPAIKLDEAMVVWTANRGPWLEAGNWAPAGSVAVVHWPDDKNAWTRYPSSYGACNSEYREGSDADRLQSLADLWEQFSKEDNMNMDHVAEAFRAIEGIERIAGFKGKLPR